MTDKELKREFGRKLRIQLARLEYSQTDFSEKIGCSRARVSQWINGTVFPVSNAQAEIFTALNMTPAEFWGIE